MLFQDLRPEAVAQIATPTFDTDPNVVRFPGFQLLTQIGVVRLALALEFVGKFASLGRT